MRLICVFLIFALFSAVFFSGCGGDSGNRTSVAVSISPEYKEMSQDALFMFKATVTGTTDTTVTWSVEEGAEGGEIESHGFYHSPKHGGTYHVIATSNADSSSYARAVVKVGELSLP